MRRKNVTLPPDPATIAPPVDPTVATTTFAATEFLYTGSNPIQTGVAMGVIEPKRAAVIRGRVLDDGERPSAGSGRGQSRQWGNPLDRLRRYPAGHHPARGGSQNRGGCNILQR